MYAAGTHPAALLTKLTQPSGSVYAQVSYDPLTGRVTSDTDSNGGTWQVGMPATQGSSQAWVSSVLGAQPADYYRLNDTGATQATDLAYHCACSSPATYNNVSEGVSDGPFDDQPVTGYNGTSSYLSLPTSDTDSGGPDTVGVWFKTTGTNEVLYSRGNRPGHGIGAVGVRPGAVHRGRRQAERRVLRRQLHHRGFVTRRSTTATGTTRSSPPEPAPQSLYVDGALQSTISGSVASEPWTNAAAGTGFAGGSWPDLSSSAVTARWFNGDLAELAWYPVPAVGRAGVRPVEHRAVRHRVHPDPGRDRHRPRRQHPEVRLRPAQRRAGAVVHRRRRRHHLLRLRRRRVPGLDHRPRRRRHHRPGTTSAATWCRKPPASTWRPTSARPPTGATIPTTRRRR